MACPYCRDDDNQVAWGRSVARTQRYRCKVCKRSYSPWGKRTYRIAEFRMLAVSVHRHHFEDFNYSIREIARWLEVNHQSVSNWISEYEHEKDIPEFEVAMQRFEEAVKGKQTGG